MITFRYYIPKYGYFYLIWIEIGVIHLNSMIVKKMQPGPPLGVYLQVFWFSEFLLLSHGQGKSSLSSTQEKSK